MEGLREPALPLASEARFPFLALLRLPTLSARKPCLFVRSTGSGGSGVPSSRAAAPVSGAPNSAASFSARFDALCKLLRRG